jgi:predicted nucleic acid-binding protein
MLADKAFIDTNLLVYFFTNDEHDKHNLVVNQLDKYDRIISTQVLNEFCNVCIRKNKMDLQKIDESIPKILEFCTLSIVNVDTVKLALTIHRKYHYSYYDSLIIASALENKCDYLLSEDMNNGQVIEKTLTILNIFNPRN